MVPMLYIQSGTKWPATAIQMQLTELTTTVMKQNVFQQVTVAAENHQLLNWEIGSFADDHGDHICHEISESANFDSTVCCNLYGVAENIPGKGDAEQFCLDSRPTEIDTP